MHAVNGADLVEAINIAIESQWHAMHARRHETQNTTIEDVILAAGDDALRHEYALRLLLAVKRQAFES